MTKLLKLPADPQPDMLAITVIAEACLRHDPTLAVGTWTSGVRRIREALENIEDIYDRAEDGK